MKTFFAVIVGVVSCLVLVLGIEKLGSLLFPSTLEIIPKNAADLKRILDATPMAGLISVIVAHGVGMYLGIFAGYKIQPKSMVPFLVIFIIMLMGTVSNLAILPHPAWFMIADVCVIFGVALVGWLGLKWQS